MIISKEQIEKEVGYKIQDLKLEPLYEGNVCVGLKVNVVPEQKVEFINIQFSVQEEDAMADNPTEYICSRCGWKGSEDEMIYEYNNTDEVIYYCPTCENIINLSETNENISDDDHITLTRKELREFYNKPYNYNQYIPQQARIELIGWNNLINELYKKFKNKIK